MATPHKTIMKLIPEGEKTFDLGEIKCKCEGNAMAVVPTDKRLMTCTRKFFGLYKIIDDFSWATFDHVTVTQKLGTFTMELRYRKGEKTLKLERLTKESFDSLYRRVRERITVYDEKYKISSKICPMCREIINFEAKQCPFCLHQFARIGDQPDAVE